VDLAGAPRHRLLERLGEVAFRLAEHLDASPRSPDFGSRCSGQRPRGISSCEAPARFALAMSSLISGLEQGRALLLQPGTSACACVIAAFGHLIVSFANAPLACSSNR